MTDMGFIPDDKDLNKSFRPARDGDSPVPPDDESFFAGADPLAEYEDVSDAPNRLTETEDRREMRDSTAYEADAPDEILDCKWITVDEALERTDMWFEDHLHIVETMIGTKDL